jgi:hypothetical protein
VIGFVWCPAVKHECDFSRDRNAFARWGWCHRCTVSSRLCEKFQYECSVFGVTGKECTELFFCTSFCYLQDTDSTLFLKKSRRISSKLSRIGCFSKQIFLNLIGEFFFVVKLYKIKLHTIRQEPSGSHSLCLPRSIHPPSKRLWNHVWKQSTKFWVQYLAGSAVLCNCETWKEWERWNCQALRYSHAVATVMAARRRKWEYGVHFCPGADTWAWVYKMACVCNSPLARFYTGRA